VGTSIHEVEDGTYNLVTIRNGVVVLAGNLTGEDLVELYEKIEYVLTAPTRK
jgi:hypothetical protein